VLCKATFCPEVAALKVVDHPQIVSMKEYFGEGQSGSVCVIDFISGSSLQKRVDGEEVIGAR